MLAVHLKNVPKLVMKNSADVSGCALVTDLNSKMDIDRIFKLLTTVLTNSKLNEARKLFDRLPDSNKFEFVYGNDTRDVYKDFERYLRFHSQEELDGVLAELSKTLNESSGIK